MYFWNRLIETTCSDFWIFMHNLFGWFYLYSIKPRNQVSLQPQLYLCVEELFIRYIWFWNCLMLEFDVSVVHALTQKRAHLHLNRNSWKVYNQYEYFFSRNILHNDKNFLYLYMLLWQRSTWFSSLQAKLVTDRRVLCKGFYSLVADKAETEVFFFPAWADVCCRTHLQLSAWNHSRLSLVCKLCTKWGKGPIFF